MKKIYISGKITDNPNYKADFEAAELADIITCALIAAANEDIDIEKALKDSQQKNEARAMEGSK